MHLEQLPRDDCGAVTGSWRLRHRARDFSDEFGGVTFRDGVTTKPLPGPIAARLLVIFGDVLEAEPWDSAYAPAEAPPVAPTETSPTAAPDTSQAPAQKPSTWAELETMDERALIRVAEELGRVDRRWRAHRLREFIADELGIDTPESTHV